MTLVQNIGDDPNNLYVEADTLQIELQIVNDLQEPVDLALWSLADARFRLSKRLANGGFVPVHDMSLGSGISYPGGNVLLILVPAGATAGHRELYHETELKSVAGVVNTPVVGRVKITPESIPTL